MSGHIIYDERELYRPKIEEKEEELKKSYFTDEYEDIIALIKEIIEEGQNNIKKNDLNKIKIEEINNIIAITGQRGSGKSSVMGTICNLLKNPNDYEELIGKNEDNINIRDFKYEVLDPIDPTIFEKNDSIINILISQLFKRYREFLNKNEDEMEKNIYGHRELLKKFQKVYRNLKQLSKSNKEIFQDEQDELEILSELSASFDMKANLSELINEYLEVVKKSSVLDSYLVIPIDDMDMNFTYAYKMVEDIRRYLMENNIIILMTYYPIQLEDIIKKNFIEQYGMYSEKNIKSTIDDESLYKDKVSIMALKYIEKLIPEGRKVNIKDAGYLDICERGEKGIEINLKDKFKELLENKFNYYSDFQENNNIDYSYLFPDSLRGKLNFYKKINQYKDKEIGKNVDDFLGYILRHWANSKFNNSSIFLDLYKMKDEDITEINNYFIKKFLPKTDNDKKTADEDGDKIIDDEEVKKEVTIKDKIIQYLKNKTYYNYSIGDAAAAFALGERSLQDKNLFNALKMVYFLFLEKAYNENKDSYEKVTKDIVGLLPLYLACGDKSKEDKFMYNESDIKFAFLISNENLWQNNEMLKNSVNIEFNLKDEMQNYICCLNKDFLDYDKRIFNNMDYVLYLAYKIVENDNDVSKLLNKDTNYLKNNKLQSKRTVSFQKMLNSSKEISLYKIRKDIKHIYERINKGRILEVDENEFSYLKYRSIDLNNLQYMYLENNCEIESLICSDIYKEFINKCSLMELNTAADYIKYKNVNRAEVKELINLINKFYDFNNRFNEICVLKVSILNQLENMRRSINVYSLEEENDDYNDFINQYNKLVHDLRINRKRRLLKAKRIVLDINLSNIFNYFNTDDTVKEIEYSFAKVNNIDDRYNKMYEKFNTLREFFTDIKYRDMLDYYMGIEKEVLSIKDWLLNLYNMLSDEELDKMILLGENLSEFILENEEDINAERN